MTREYKNGSKGALYGPYSGYGDGLDVNLNGVNGDGNDSDGNDGVGTGLLSRPESKTKKPSMYKVIMLNDDYTPMEFVVHILQRFFRMTLEEATEVMLSVHNRGIGICGVFTYEVAETKVNQVMVFAKQHEQPLQCTMEKE